MNTICTTLITVSFLLGCSIAMAQRPFKFANDSKSEKYLTTELVQSNFDLVGGLILVDALLDGTTEKFVFDTGAPHLFLNTKNRTCKKSKHQIIGVGGLHSLDVKKDVAIKWSGKTIKNKQTYGIDLSHIEKAKGTKIGGLMGYDMVKGKELVIDYKSQKLYLISKSNKTFFSGHEKVDKVFFRMVGHIPVIRVRFGKKTFYFGIDTGAEVNVIDKRLKGKIPEALISSRSNTKVIGINKVAKKTDSIKVKSMKVGKHTYGEMDFVFTDLSNFQQNCNIELDGFLGYAFLTQANFSINYRKNQLIRWQPISPKKEINLVRTEH